MTELPRRLDGESPEQSAIRKVRSSCLGVLLWLRNQYSHPVIWVVSIKRGSTRAFSPVPVVEASAPPGLLPSEVPSSLAGIFDAIRRGADVTEQHWPSWWGVTRVQPGDSPGKQSAQLNQLLRASARVMTVEARRAA